MNEETTESAPRAWTKPVADEVKMDAEIGSYQADEDTPPFVAEG